MSSKGKIEKLHALFERTGSDGEKAAIIAAIGRLEASSYKDETREWTVRFPDYGSSRLFETVCAKYGVHVYQYKGQKRTTLNYKTTTEIKEPLVEEYNALFEKWVELTDELLFDLMVAYTAAATPITAMIETSNKGVE